MRRVVETACATCLVALTLAAGSASAQAAGAKTKPPVKPAAATPRPDSGLVHSSALADSGSPVSDSITPAGKEIKKKGGLFGKVKSVAGNKVVQSVAKTAACTMVPGGQAIVGAIDAAANKSVAEAAAGAAGAAPGTSCIPGGMGAPGVAGTAIQAAAQLGAAASRAPTVEMPADAMGYASMAGMPSPEQTARCMGLTLEEFEEFTNPTRGQARQMTKAEMKRQAKIGKKVDARGYQACMMQQASVQMAVAQQTTALAQDQMASADTEDAAKATGKVVSLSPDLVADLKRGRTVVRDIDWVEGAAQVSEAGLAAFTDAMTRLAQALREVGGSYRTDIYLDQRYDAAAVSTIGPARLERVQAALENGGLSSGVLKSGRAKKDKNPRLEVIKVK